MDFFKFIATQFFSKNSILNNSVLKYCNTLSNMNMTCRIIFISSDRKLYVLSHQVRKTILNIITLMTMRLLADHHFTRSSRVLAIWKVNSKELHWLPIVTTELINEPHKITLKKIPWPKRTLEKSLRDISYSFQYYQ